MWSIKRAMRAHLENKRTKKKDQRPRDRTNVQAKRKQRKMKRSETQSQPGSSAINKVEGFHGNEPGKSARKSARGSPNGPETNLIVAVEYIILFQFNYTT